MLMTIFVVAFVAVAAVVLVNQFQGQAAQQVIGDQCTVDADCGTGFQCNPSGACEVQPTVVATATGKSASVKFAAISMTNNSDTQVGEPGLYVWEKDCPTCEAKLIANNGNLLATSRLTVSTSTGKFLDAAAWQTNSSGNRGLYGLLRENIEVTKEVQNEDVDVWFGIVDSSLTDLITTEPNFGLTIFDEDGTALAVADRNISLGANQENEFEKIRFTNNQTDTAFRFGALIFNTNDSTNIDQITVNAGDGTFTEGTLPKRLKTSEFIWQLDVPVLMLEFDDFETGSILYKADSTGCVTDDDLVRVRIVDVGEYLTKDGQQYATGFEDDSDSNNDVGMPDMEFRLSCDPL